MPVYIDPTSATNGAGTYADPRNTWSGVTWTAGETYLQKEGTTFASQITVYDNTASSGGTVAAIVTPI